MMSGNPLEQVKIRLRQYTVDTDGSLIFNKMEDNPYIQELIEENTEFFKNYRNYPSSFTDSQIEADIEKHLRDIVNLALYDYNKEGVEFEDSNSENGYSRHYSDKSKILSHVIPYATIA